MPSSRTPSGVIFDESMPVLEYEPKAQMKALKVTMMTMLLRTGVHIIAPNRPRALRI